MDNESSDSEFLGFDEGDVVSNAACNNSGMDSESSVSEFFGFDEEDVVSNAACNNPGMDSESSGSEFFGFDEGDFVINGELDLNLERELHPDLELDNARDIEQTAEEKAEGWTAPATDDSSAAAGFHFATMPNQLQMDSDSRKPIDFFNALFDQQMWLQIADETNRYAAQRRQSLGEDAFTECNHPNYRRYARLNKWRDTNPAELKKWVAHLILMGLTRKPDIEMYWSTDDMTRTPFFGVHMSRDRFTAILSNFHVDNDNDNPPYDSRNPDNGHDPLAKVRSFYHMMQRNFRYVYKPDRELSVDEGTMPWRGRLRFKQFNPSKPAKFHVKLYQISEAKSGYVICFRVYTGKGSCHTDDCSIDPFVNVTTKTVLTLMEDGELLEKGHHLYMDNFYTSPELLLELLDRETPACGTLRTNRKMLPKSIMGSKCPLPEGGSAFRRLPVTEIGGGGLLALRWKDKKLVAMLTSIHGATETWTGKLDRRDGTPVYKLTCIVQYTKWMGGVDVADQLMSYYHFLRRTIKWWRKLWVHMLNMIIMNAFLLNRKFGEDKKLSHFEFRTILARELLVEANGRELSPLPTNRLGIPVDRLHGRHFPEKIRKMANNRRVIPKVCVVCRKTPKDELQGLGMARQKFTSFQCNICKKAMCVADCFRIYHSVKDYKEAVEALF